MSRRLRDVPISSRRYFEFYSLKEENIASIRQPCSQALSILPSRTRQRRECLGMRLRINECREKRDVLLWRIRLHQVAYQRLLTQERQTHFILGNKIPYEKRCLFSSPTVGNKVFQIYCPSLGSWSAIAKYWWKSMTGREGTFFYSPFLMSHFFS